MSIQRNNFDLVLCNRYLTTLWGQLMLWTREPTSLYAGPISCLPTVAVQPWGFPQRHLCTLCQQRYNEHTVLFQWNTCIGICICKTWNSLLLFIFCIASNKFFMFLNLNIFEMWTVECQWCNSIFVMCLQQMTFLLSTLTDYRKSVMLVGENGCGKTAIINDKIRTAYSGEVAEVLSLTIQANR